MPTFALQMPLWRRYPPVHGALPAGAIRASLAALSPTGAAAATASASAAIAARYPGSAHQLLDSGTTALSRALAATQRVGISPVVALPAYACPDVGAAALGAGFGIRLYDLDPDTLQPDLASLELALDEGASHVVCTHLFGRLVDIARVAPMAAARGAIVIEDAAQHAGGTLRGIRGGALAPISVLSFGRGKGINAGGGGALLWRAPVHLNVPAVPTTPRPSGVKILCASVLVDRLSAPSLYRLPTLLPWLGLGETVYHPPHAHGPLTGVSAALLALALDAEPAMLARRRAAEAEYHEALGAIPGLLCQAHPEAESGALRCPIRLHPSQAAPLAALGVSRSYPRTLAAYPEIRAAVVGRTDWPGAQSLADTLHTLPTHGLLPRKELEGLIRILREQCSPRRGSATVRTGEAT